MSWQERDPPSVGQSVTVPLLSRQINRLPQLSTEVTDAYVGLYMVATADVLDAADSVMRALDHASQTFNRTPRRKRGRPVHEALTGIDAAIAGLVAAVRADRRFKPINQKTG